MGIVVELDAIEHWTGGDAGRLKTIGQFDMVEAARPFGEMPIDFIGMRSAGQLIGEARIASP